MFTVDEGAARPIGCLQKGLRSSYSVHVRNFEAFEKCEDIMYSVEIVINYIMYIVSKIVIERHHIAYRYLSGTRCS